MRHFSSIIAVGTSCLILFAGTMSDAEETREPGPHPASQSLKNPIEAKEASFRAGRQVYQRYCVTCHGMDGKGQTDIAEDLPVKPTDFTKPERKYGNSDGEIFTLIQHGTKFGMDAYKEKVKEQRIWHLVNYIQNFSANAEKKLAPDAVPENPIEYNTTSLKRGRAIYENHCAICHASDGSGYTDYLDFLPVPPADLTTGSFRYGNRDGDLFVVIRDGTATGMESFSESLPEDDIWHSINYIRRFAKRKQ